MSKVSVIGVGDVGATAAYTLQISGLATEIVLIDADTARAEGQALDMNHGLFFTPPVTIRAGDYAECAGSRLIVITAGARQKPGETRLDLIRRNAAICQSILQKLEPHIGDAQILVITNPVDVLTYVALQVSGLPAPRVFGSGTVLDSARFRYELSQRCGVDARNVHAYVVGEHGDSEVFLWSQVHIAGTPLDAFCRGCEHSCAPPDRVEVEKAVRDSAYHVIEKKGFTNYAVGLAVRRIAGALLRDEQSVLTVSTLLSGDYGIENICLSVPCLVGSRGVERIIATDLSDPERTGLLASAAALRAAIDAM